MSFPKTLNSLNGGQTVSDMSEAFAELVQSIEAYGKKGTITLKLEIEPSKDINGGVFINPSISVSPPKKPQRKALMYLNKGELQTKDPRQPDLDGLTVVEGGVDAAVEVETNTN